LRSLHYHSQCRLLVFPSFFLILDFQNISDFLSDQYRGDICHFIWPTSAFVPSSHFVFSPVPLLLLISYSLPAFSLLLSSPTRSCPQSGSVAAMDFDKDSCELRTIFCGAPLYFVVADLKVAIRPLLPTQTRVLHPCALYPYCDCFIVHYVACDFIMVYYIIFLAFISVFHRLPSLFSINVTSISISHISLIFISLTYSHLPLCVAGSEGHHSDSQRTAAVLSFPREPNSGRATQCAVPRFAVPYCALWYCTVPGVLEPHNTCCDVLHRGVAYCTAHRPPQ
jgi:hypothetical protein